MSVLTSYAIGLAAIATLCAAWLAVQLAWRRVFPDASGDPDALAGRLGCHACDCTGACEKRAPKTAGANEEGTA
jgi:hypothetical protein